MKGRPFSSLDGRSSCALALGTALLFAQHAAAQDGQQPGNPTSLAGFSFTPTLKIALIAGGGGLVLLIILIVVVCCVRRRKKKKRLPMAQTPVATTFNPDALPSNPAPLDPQASTATFEAGPPLRRLSDRLPPNPAPFNEYNRSGTPAPPEPAYGGYERRGASPAPLTMGNAAARPGAETTAKLRVGGTPHPPSGVGIDGWQQGGRAGGWAAVEQAQAWGMHGRHIDQQGQYYGSIAQQGGQAPPQPRGMRPPGGGLPPPVRHQHPPAQPAVYGDDDIYSQRAYAAEHEEEGYSPRAKAQNSAADRYQPGGGNAYPRTGAGGGPYSPATSNPYANPYASNQDRYAPNRTGNPRHGGGGGGGGYGQSNQPQGGGYGDYGAGQYGHSRDGSAESDRSYYNYGAQRPADPNRWL